tara:strand:+ start:30 stop:659 length:630 start_codon:yes stop_codon:yes gene_type:complete
MSILNRDVFNEYNLNYDPVGLRNIAMPESFFTKAFAPEPTLEELQELQNRQALNRAGIMAIDNAGLTIPAYEDFAQVAKPGFNLGFAKQLGTTALGLLTGNPIVGLIARGLGALGNKLGPQFTGVKGGQNLYGDTNFNTFAKSTSFADFAQRMRDKRAREDAAARGAAKQRAKDLDYEFDAYGGGNQSGGFADNSNASAPGGSDEMGSF